MKPKEDDLFYDDDEAIVFILNTLPEETRKHINDTHIEYVLDVIYEFYEQNGWIEEDSTEEAEINEDAMFDYIVKAVKKDKFDLSEEEVEQILNGEFEYGKSIGIYNDK
ncbi:MAG: hypothetical protein LBN23_01445 [Paludibacter sp.]|jgi:hypothetical protein|nr:hypothetical protein [Paludibacter sp.]